MITIKSIKDTNYNDFDEVWAIVRSMKSPSKHIKQVPELSPSLNLFFKHRTLVRENKWNKQAFDEIYAPQFLKEMHEKSATNLLNKLYQLDKNGKKICLVCFCPDETLCHRSIIAGLLQGVGCNINIESGKDCSKYHELYKDIK